MDSSIELDEIGERFESFWSLDREDPIRDFIAAESFPSMPKLPGLLLEIDIERRRQAGGEIRESDYLERYAEWSELVATAFKNCRRRIREAELEATVLESSTPEESTIVESDLSRPEQVGHFLLGKQLGQGGMGTVFEATQLEPFRRQVALKLIRPGADSHTDLARFQSERQALALMDHPNIARVYEAGVSRDQPFLAMELVKGAPITAYCDHHKLTLPERLELFIQTCRAVQHAHTKGVIHRDIKPSNVLVTEVEGAPVVKVIDFGLARAFGEDVRLVDKTITADIGAIAGTLAYMSPEQTRPQSVDTDTRSDVYSLGALLYELLTGSTPISRKEVKTMALSEVLNAICERDAVTPSQKVLTSNDLDSLASSRSSSSARLSSLIKRDLDWITIRALEKDRERRYQSPEELAADLQRHLQNEPVIAGPPSLIYRARKLVRRNPISTAVGVLLVISLFAAGGLVRWMEQIESQRNEQSLRADLEQKKRELQEQENLVQELTSSIGRFDDVAVESRLASLKSAIATEQLSPEQRADLQFHSFDLLRSIQQFSDADDVLSEINPQSKAQQAELLYRRFLSSDSPNLRRELKASLTEFSGFLSEADREFLAALEFRHPAERILHLSALLERSPGHPDCRRQLMLALVLTGRTDELYRLVESTRLLFPDDPSPLMYQAFSAAFAGEDIVLQQCLDDLAAFMGEEERVPVAEALQSLCDVPEILVGLEFATPSTSEIFGQLTEMAGHASLIEGDSPVLRSVSQQIELGAGFTGKEIPPTAALLSRLGVISGQLLFGVTSGVEGFLEDVEKSSPIPNDAFFPFAQGLVTAGKEGPAAAVPFFQEATQRPSVFPVVSSEACWILHLSARGRYQKTDDPADLELAKNSVELWLDRDPQWNDGRLKIAVDTALASKAERLARRLLEAGGQNLSEADAEVVSSRIRILFSERAFVPVIELCEEVLKSPEWEQHSWLPKVAKEHQEKALAELGKLVPSQIQDEVSGADR